ncbi:MAG: GNAT family N-acetyltransferase [Crocinitomicaceae bacterium]|nr:GNAT family N-acetyltransferase [Crocinitomicaceae bacterium]
MTSFQTARTYIRPLTKEDYPSILEMYQEEDSFKFIRPLRGLSLEEYSNFIDKKMIQNENEVGFWCVFSKDENTFIGTVNLNEFANTGKIQIGCHLKRNVWNKGYGFELMKAVLNYGFETRGLKSIHGVYEKKHIVSAKLMKQLGFSFLETMPFGDTDVNIMILEA